MSDKPDKIKTLDEYEQIAREAIENDKDTTKMFKAFDDMENCKWALPTELASLPGMRPNINTEPADAIKASTRVYASNKPVIELSPLNSFTEERARMSIIEQVLDWHFDRLNKKPKAPLYTIVHDAIKYMRVAFQVEYYPYLFKGRKDEPRNKHILRFGDFGWRMHDPKNVHAYYDDDALDSVILCTKLTIKELINRFGRDNDGIKKLLTKLKKSETKDWKLNENTTTVTFVDITDWKYRVQWCYEDDTMDSEKYEILREAHGLPFINWVFVTGENPILKTTYDSNAWDDANMVGSLRNRLITVAAAHPAYVTKTNSGRGVDIDYTDGVGTVDVQTNEAVEPLVPRQLDPHLTEIYAEVGAKIRNTSGTKYLQNLDFPANTPYASINALITASMSNLYEAKRLAESAIATGMYLNLWWISHSKEKSWANRTKTDTMLEENMQLGAQIGISGDYDNLVVGEVFIGDPNDIDININLRPNELSDKQQRLNMAQVANQELQVPISAAHEMAGFDNSALLVEEWQTEQISNAELAIQIKQMQTMADEQIKQQIIQEYLAQQEAQMKAAQEAQAAGVQPPAPGQQPGLADQARMMQAQGNPQQSPQEMAFANAKGPGYAGSEGGQPVQMMAPGSTREKMSGKTKNGEEVL